MARKRLLMGTKLPRKTKKAIKTTGWRCPYCKTWYPKHEWIKTKFKGYYMCPAPDCLKITKLE